MSARLVAAAIKWKGVVYTGVRHGQIIKQIVELGQTVDGEHVTDAEQGFVDADNQYWQRAEAAGVAIASGQVSPDKRGTLYSEDLW